MDDILQRKRKANEDGGSMGYDYGRALILVPNKELVQQVVRMAMALSGGDASVVFGGWTLADAAWFGKDNNQPDKTKGVPQKEEEMVRIAVMPGGLNALNDFPPFRNTVAMGGREAPVDLLVSTPASVGPLGLKPKNIAMFADIQTVVVDECDLLLDGGYIRELENVFLGFRRADKLPDDAVAGNHKTQHVFVAATLPDYGVRSVDQFLLKRFPRATRVTLAGMHNAKHYGLQEPTVWIDQQSKKARMEKLVDLLKQERSEGGLKGEKVMIFVNTVGDVEGSSEALERAGIPVLSYHAKVPLAERSVVLDRFRNFSSTSSSKTDIDGSVSDTTPNKKGDKTAVGILVCTDLAARGIDVPGVNTVVQLQMATNVVGHLHRMGRCGRAGQRTGRGIVFYGDQERELATVIREAETQQERMTLEGDVIDLEDPLDEQAGNVKKAFSRKRSFKKKIKQRERNERAASASEDETIESQP